MSITVKEALEIGGLKDCKVVAGFNGLNRKIEHVTVMEIPDVVSWLKGNDFLLTSLLPIKDDERSLHNLVAKLEGAGSTALAIKNRFFNRVPPIIIKEGNRLNFPIIEIKQEVPYLDIITPLMKKILTLGSSSQNNIEEFFKWITELALGGKGLYTLAQAVEGFLGNPLSIESEIPLIEEVNSDNISPLHFVQMRELKRSKRPVRLVRTFANEEVPCIVAPIILNEELFGYITCWEINEPFEKIDLVVIERLVSLFALEFLKMKTKIDVQEEYKSDLLYDVLIGRVENKAEIIEKSRLFNWDLTLDYRIVVLEIEEVDELKVRYYKNKIFKKTDHLLVENAIVTIVSDNIIVFYPYEDKRETEFARFLKQLRVKVRKELKEVAVTIGVGGFYPSMDGIQHSFEEALNAIKIGHIIGRSGKIIDYNELGVYKLLYSVKDRDSLKQYCHELIQLIEYDKKNNTDLVQTLKMYFDLDYSMTATAESLFIHINTLKYRLERIESITSLSIHLAEDRLKLHLSLKILDILE